MAIAEEAAGAERDAIHREGDPRKEQLHSAGELRAIISLDEQVHMVVLNRIVQDTHAACDGYPDLPNQGAKHAFGPQARRQPRPLDGDMNGVLLVMCGPRDVRNEPEPVRAGPSSELSLGVTLARRSLEGQDLLERSSLHSHISIALFMALSSWVGHLAGVVNDRKHR